MARDTRIMFKVEKDVKDSFEALAKEYGLTISSYGAYVIGAHLKEKEEKTGAHRQADVNHERGNLV